MRFIGLLFVLASVAIAWFLGIQGTGNVVTDFNAMRTRLAALLNLPGLNPSTPGSTSTDKTKPMNQNPPPGVPAAINPARSSGGQVLV